MGRESLERKATRAVIRMDEKVSDNYILRKLFGAALQILFDHSVKCFLRRLILVVVNQKEYFFCSLAVRGKVLNYLPGRRIQGNDFILNMREIFCHIRFSSRPCNFKCFIMKIAHRRFEKLVEIINVNVGKIPGQFLIAYFFQLFNQLRFNLPESHI